MTVHLFRARPLADELAADDVTAKQQALYLALSFVAGLIPGYAFLIPRILTEDAVWFWSMHLYELLVLAIIYVAGTLYCLRCCHYRPGQHFLKDFTCLYLPCFSVAMLIGWGLFYGLVWGSRAMVAQMTFTEEPGRWLRLLFSTRMTDTLRFLTMVGTTAATFYRIGRFVERVSKSRLIAAQGEESP